MFERDGSIQERAMELVEAGFHLELKLGGDGAGAYVVHHEFVAGPEIGKNSIPSTGIPYVIVNGTVVVDDSKVQRVAPGVAIRNAIVE